MRVELVLVGLCLCACGPTAQRGATPACLYELTPAFDGGSAGFVVQQFESFAVCNAYERFCNSAPWPLQSSPRCTACCDVCR